MIPSSLNLSAKQLQQLHDAGIQLGTPFCLANDGSLTSPESKRFQLKMVHGFASIAESSVRLIEHSVGKFSLEFAYSATRDFECSINFHVQDYSSSSRIE
jgi:hypothetical protein